MNRRLILILTIILIIAIAVAAFLFFRNTPSEGGAPTSFFDSLLPSGLPGGSGFGNGGTSIIGGATTTPGSNLVVVPRLRHLTLVPTAGSIVLVRQLDVIENRIRTTKNAYYVRYMDRATGHISEIKTDEPTAVKITNTTIPKVYEAIFVPSGNTIIARFLADDEEQILTYSIALRDKPISAATTSKPTVANEKALSEQNLKDVVGTYLPGGIEEIALSGNGSRLLSLSNTNGRGSFVVSDTSGRNSSTALTHPIHEWLLSFPNETTAVATTKPSGIANGYGYTLNLANGSLRKITGGIAGLTLLPNANLTTYLGGATPGNTIRLFTVTSEDSEPQILPLSTLPEKCVWAKKEVNTVYCAVPSAILPATYPDDWYKGKVSFSDQIWKINTVTQETSLISNLPIESKQTIDGVNLMISPDDTYLTFINKIDLTLWGLDLSVK